MTPNGPLITHSKMIKEVGKGLINLVNSIILEKWGDK